MSNATSTQIQPAPVAAAKPARFIITAEVEGFPVTVEVEGKADCLKAMVERLKAIGATPPQPVASAKTGEHSTPICPVHGSPMKASRKPGKFYCAKKAADGEYCRETA